MVLPRVLRYLDHEKTQNYLNSDRNLNQMLSKTFTLQCSVKRDTLKRMNTD